MMRRLAAGGRNFHAYGTRCRDSKGEGWSKPPVRKPLRGRKKHERIYDWRDAKCSRPKAKRLEISTRLADYAAATSRLTHDIGVTGLRIAEGIVNSNYEDLKSTVRNSLIILAAVLLLGAALAVGITRMITKPLRATVDFAQGVAAGNLDQELALHARDETGRLADALRSMVGSLRQRLAEVTEQSEQARRKGEEARLALEEAHAARKAADSARREGIQSAAARMEDIVRAVSEASEILSSRIAGAGAGAEDAAAGMGETSTAMDEMNATVSEVARNASETASFSDRMRSRAHEGAGVVRDAVNGIEKARNQPRCSKKPWKRSASRPRASAGL